jgi:hypothetical protein
MYNVAEVPLHGAHFGLECVVQEKKLLYMRQEVYVMN